MNGTAEAGRASVMEGFEVVLELASPVALGALPYAPTLDSVLLALLSGGEMLTGSEADDLYARLAATVLVSNGLPAASCLWPGEAERPVAATTAYPRSPSVEEMRHWASGTYGETVVPENPMKNRSTESSGPYTTKMHTVRSVFAGSWSWWGVGDVEEVERLLCSAPLSVGGQRGSGYGLVTDITVRACDDGAWRTLGVGPYTLGRPVPLRLLDEVLAAGEVGRDDLDPDRYSIVPLPIWPKPAWGVGPYEPTTIPVLDVQVEGSRDGT